MIESDSAQAHYDTLHQCRTFLDAENIFPHSRYSSGLYPCLLLKIFSATEHVAWRLRNSGKIADRHTRDSKKKSHILRYFRCQKG